MSIFNVVNQFSFVMAAVLGGTLFALFLWRWQQPPAALRGALFAVYILAVLGLKLALNYRPTFGGSLESVEATLENERPSLLMLYSNY